MESCCNPGVVLDRQRHALSVVLVINLAMFLIELGAGLRARSSALLADSADMLGDAVVYGFSLYIVGRGSIWQARGALLKGALMGVFGAGILAEAGTKLVRGVVPGAALMSGVGLLALAANAVVLGLLWRHRADDLNMRSVWLCSRNDVVANVGVLVAALGVRLTDRAWPDIVVGVAIAGLLVMSAAGVIRAAALRPAAADRAA
jgi:Co/Zn/Cd efflux system component